MPESPIIASLLVTCLLASAPVEAKPQGWRATAEARIGPEGGKLSLGRRAVVQIEPGAFEKRARVRLVEVPRELTGHELSGFVFVGPSVQLWIDGDRPRKRPSLSFPAPRLPRGVAASRVKLMKGGPAIADGIDRHGRKVSERVRAHTAHSPRRVDRRLGPVFLIHYSPGTLYQPMAECSAEAEELTRLLKAPGKPCLRACASFLSLGRSPSAPALEKDSRYRVCAAMCKKGCLKRSCLLRAKAQADLAVCM